MSLSLRSCDAIVRCALCNHHAEMAVYLDPTEPRVGCSAVMWLDQLALYSSPSHISNNPLNHRDPALKLLSDLEHAHALHPEFSNLGFSLR